MVAPAKDNSQGASYSRHVANDFTTEKQSVFIVKRSDTSLIIVSKLVEKARLAEFGNSWQFVLHVEPAPMK